MAQPSWRAMRAAFRRSRRGQVGIKRRLSRSVKAPASSGTNFAPFMSYMEKAFWSLVVTMGTLAGISLAAWFDGGSPHTQAIAAFLFRMFGIATAFCVFGLFINSLLLRSVLFGEEDTGPGIGYVVCTFLLLAWMSSISANTFSRSNSLLQVMTRPDFKPSLERSDWVQIVDFVTEPVNNPWTLLVPMSENHRIRSVFEANNPGRWVRPGWQKPECEDLWKQPPRTASMPSPPPLDGEVIRGTGFVGLQGELLLVQDDGGAQQLTLLAVKPADDTRRMARHLARILQALREEVDHIQCTRPTFAAGTWICGAPHRGGWVDIGLTLIRQGATRLDLSAVSVMPQEMGRDHRWWEQIAQIQGCGIWRME